MAAALDVVRPGDAQPPSPPPPRFFFDLGSPASYLVAERVLRDLPVLAEWVPVAWGAEPSPDWPALQEHAATLGLLALRRPPNWPPDTARAMRAVTYAKQIGKAVAFSQAAFRQAYAAGLDLGATNTLLIAGAAAEMHPRAVLQALELRGVGKALAVATAGARAAGVTQVPALVLSDGSVYDGASCLIEATAALT